MAEPNPAFCSDGPRFHYALPARRTADSLVQHYWELTYTVYSFLDCAAFEEDYQALWIGSPTRLPERIVVAMVNIVFALGTQVSRDVPPEQRQKAAKTYYDETQNSLSGISWDMASLELVSCLLLTGVFLQTINRPQRCWMVIGHAIRMAENLGLHMPEYGTGTQSGRWTQLSRRVWHGCVLMDRVLSMTLGRPGMVSSSLATGVPLPLEIDEDFLDTQSEGSPDVILRSSAPLISGPFSETFGRSVVYIVTLIIFLLLIMASALAPNLASHFVFRFTAGVFAATPLTCAGGTVSYLWDPLQKTYGFPIYVIPAFTGPMIGQVIGSYIPSTLGWRWLEWIMLITGGIVLVLVVLLQKETYQDLLLQWKALALRKRTGNQNYKGPMELRSLSLRQRLTIAIYRPFVWGLTEPIVIFMSLYLTAVYIILFLFLEGYQFIFKDIYHFSEGQTNLVWVAMVVGAVSTAIQIPVIWTWTKEYKQAGNIPPERRILFAMLGGAIPIPISLFWLPWTSSSSISVWSPICATALFGFGITTVFISTHMYVIDSYEKYSASALAMLVLSRYLAAGGVTIASNLIYSEFGVPYTLSTLGAISAVMAIIPYFFYIYGHRIRKASKHAVIRD